MHVVFAYAVTSDCKTFSLNNYCPSSFNSSSTSFMIPTLLILLVDLIPTVNVHSQITVLLYCTEILFYMVVSFTKNINSLWIDSMYYLLTLILLLFLALVRASMLIE